MIILAVDTAGVDCAVAIVRLHEASWQPLAVRRDTLGRGHAEHLIPMIEEVMAKADIDFADIDRFATTIGPGSFTGLRVGVAAMRGLAAATGKPAVGIGTLEALAASALSASLGLSPGEAWPDHTDSALGPICAALDARHGNVYAQVFAGDGAPLCDPCTISVQVATSLPSFVVATGTGATLLVDNVERPVRVLDEHGCPDPVIVAALAAVRRPDEARPRPLYLKPPDAAPAPPPLPRQP